MAIMAAYIHSTLSECSFEKMLKKRFGYIGYSMVILSRNGPSCYLGLRVLLDQPLYQRFHDDILQSFTKYLRIIYEIQDFLWYIL